MKNNKWFNSRTAIIAAGILLIAYLALILSVTNFGQRRLKESQNNALYLKVLNYSDNLSFYFDVAKEHLSHLTQDHNISIYFLNRSAGMSLQYGLGVSLYNLQQSLRTFLIDNIIDSHRVFRRLAVVGVSGSIWADTQETEPLPIAKILNKLHATSTVSKMIISYGKSSPQIYLIKNIYSQNKRVAILVAELNNKVLKHKLTAQEHENTRSRLELTTENANILVWNTIKNQTNKTDYFISQINNFLKKSIHYEAQIKGTPFKLQAWFEPVTERDVFTSTWFIGAISFLAFPLLIGLCFFLRISNTNLILKTQIDVVANEQKKLADQNERLQEEIRKRKHSENQLRHKANHDELTGVANRILCLKRLDAAIQYAKANQSYVLVMFLDLDNFKQINDSLGHQAGDLLLQKTAKRLGDQVKKSDTIARLGGDEFLVVISDIDDVNDLEKWAHLILSVFEVPFNVEHQDFMISGSIGLATYPLDGQDPQTLIKNADMALYRMKDTGKNGFSFYHSSMNQMLQRSVNINGCLYKAILNGKMKLHYQPIYDLETFKIVGAEALIRWQDDVLGNVFPDEFIPIAEKNGLIHKIGDIVLKQACKQAFEWQKISPIKIAVNFSSVQFRHLDSVKNAIIEALNETGLAAHRLNIEVTESVLVNCDHNLAAFIASFKEKGVEFSIDDFGTGYSSLSYLQQFSFSTLKIDKRFVGQLFHKESDDALVSAILAMAKALKLKVVAEGVETQEQVTFLQQQGCKLGQGYLFSYPLSAAEFTQLLLTGSTAITGVA